MPQTLRNIVSTLASDIKALNLDDRISYRYLAAKFQNKIEYFLRIEARLRELFKDLTLWKVINCLELQEVNPQICDCIDLCQHIRRSTIDLPDAINTNYGLLIKVFTADSNKEVKIINRFEYKDYHNREFKPVNRLVAWIENKRLFIPDTDIEAVKVYIIPKDPSKVDKINGCLSPCASPLDGEVSYSPYLITLAQQEVLKELAGGKAIVEDEKGDDNTNVKK